MGGGEGVWAEKSPPALNVGWNDTSHSHAISSSPVPVREMVLEAVPVRVDVACGESVREALGEGVDEAVAAAVALGLWLGLCEVGG